jgi:hypothetical protein
MTTNTARQPKGIPVGGQFAATIHTEPSLSLAPVEPAATATRPLRPYELAENGNGTFTYNETGDRMTLEHREPVTRTDIRRALRCPRSQGRVVDLDRVSGRRSSPTDDIYEVVGPESGAPLVIRVQDGYHSLHVKSGNVHVEVLGGFRDVPGRTVIEDGARAGVVVDGDNRYTVETRGSADARVALSKESNVDVRATGTGDVHVAGGGPGCEISAKNGAVVHQDAEEDCLPVQRPNIWW